MCTYRKTLGNNPQAQENQLNYGDQTTRNSPPQVVPSTNALHYSGAGITWNVTGAPEQPPS